MASRKQLYYKMPKILTSPSLSLENHRNAARCAKSSHPTLFIVIPPLFVDRAPNLILPDARSSRNCFTSSIMAKNLALLRLPTFFSEFPNSSSQRMFVRMSLWQLANSGTAWLHPTYFCSLLFEGCCFCFSSNSRNPRRRQRFIFLHFPTRHLTQPRAQY